MEGNLSAIAKLNDAKRFLTEGNKSISQGKNVRPVKTMNQSVTPKKNKGVFEGFSDDDGEASGLPAFQNSPSLKKTARSNQPDTNEEG